MKLLRILAALVAILFGLLTVFVGTRVLLGTDPGYLVFKPLLIYNTFMGLAYIGAGVLIWRQPEKGVKAAGTIALLNALVFAAIAVLYARTDLVAVDSVRAMTLRTSVWVVLFLLTVWCIHKENGNERRE